MSLTWSHTHSRERELLALEALHHLSVQFAADRDFEELVRLFLLTLSGHFGVPGLLAAVHKPGASKSQSMVVTVGPLDCRERGTVRPEELQCWNCLQVEPDPCYGACGFYRPRGVGDRTCLRKEYGLSVVVPLLQNQTLFGIIGVGFKHTGDSLDAEEMAQLQAIAGMVTPLLLNSYLLLDIQTTKLWHESLLDSVPQAVFVCDAAGRLKMMNRSAGEIVSANGSSAPEPGGPMPLLVDVLAGIDLPDQVRQVLAKDNTASCPRGCAVVENGTGRIFNVSVSRVVDAAQGTVDTVLMLDDVTLAKKTESHLLELERLAERGAMVSSIAHEIRNVLAVLRGGIELSQIVLKRGDTAKVETYLARVLDSTRHLERFAGELVDTKKAQAERAFGSLNDVITNVATFLRVQRRFKSVTLATELDATVPPIEMDSDQISQLLLNFLNNSADAIGEAGRTEGIITVRTVHGEGGVTLSITDNGCGIPDEVRDKLFQLRFTTKKDGHGYGLITCARIIVGHQAELKVDSQQGMFTTISVVFPVARTEPQMLVR